MRYLYAVLDAQLPPPDVPGLLDAPLEAVRYADLQVLTSELPDDAVTRPAASTLCAHERVVEAAAAATDAVLPMRFGSAVRDVPRAVDLLARRHGELAHGLDRVRGAVELGLRAVRQDEGDPEPPLARQVHDGRAWLVARSAVRRRRAEVTASVHEPLAALARASRQARRVTAPTVLAASYLVDAGRVDEFRDTARRLSDEAPRAVLVCTGPWPAYSFAPVEGLAGQDTGRLGALAS